MHFYYILTGCILPECGANDAVPWSTTGGSDSPGQDRPENKTSPKVNEREKTSSNCTCTKLKFVLFTFRITSSIRFPSRISPCPFSGQNSVYEGHYGISSTIVPHALIGFAPTSAADWLAPQYLDQASRSEHQGGGS